jgi:hypothetical protein
MLLHHMRRTATPAFAAGLVLAVLAAVPAATAKEVKNLWATVNICDTKKHPDDVGIRGRMPGNGTSEKMYMKFILQFKKAGKWVTVKPGGTSPWVSAGSAKFTWGANGRTFHVNGVKAGSSFTMRGHVKYEWRSHGNVVQTATRNTTAGHPTSKGDPKNYSAATCVVSN